MTQPVDPAVAQAAVTSQLAEQAVAVGGTESAGIYGDQAGASTPAPDLSEQQMAANLQAAGATPAGSDELLAKLQAQIDDLNERLAADAAAKAATVEAATPKPPVLEEIIGALSGMAPGIVHAFQVIAARLEKAGL